MISYQFSQQNGASNSAKYFPNGKAIGNNTVLVTRGTFNLSKIVLKSNYMPVQFAMSHPGNLLKFFLRGEPGS